MHNAAADDLAEKLARQKPHDLEAQRIYLRTLVILGEMTRRRPGAPLLLLAPHDADFLYSERMLERKAGDFSVARKHLEEAVALSPNYYNPRYNLGVGAGPSSGPRWSSRATQEGPRIGRHRTGGPLRVVQGSAHSLGEAEEAREELKVYKKGLQGGIGSTVAVLKSTQAEEASKAGDSRKPPACIAKHARRNPAMSRLAYRLALVCMRRAISRENAPRWNRPIQTDPEFSWRNTSLAPGIPAARWTRQKSNSGWH